MRTIFQPDRFLLLKQLALAKTYVSGRVLDVGAGSFLRYKNLFTFAEYLTLDNAPEKHPDIVGSAEDIPVKDESFDTMISTQVLEHLPHPKKAVEEIFRILKPGGYALISVPQWNELHEEPHDYWRYTKYGLITLLTDAGFEIIVLEQRGGFFAFISQAVIRFFIDTFDLYANRFWNAVFFIPLKIYGTAMLFFDGHARAKAVRKHAIGWFCVAQKPVR
jgi:SAM-dependent methyltransferase